VCHCVTLQQGPSVQIRLQPHSAIAADIAKTNVFGLQCELFKVVSTTSVQVQSITQQQQQSGWVQVRSQTLVQPLLTAYKRHQKPSLASCSPLVAT
jgi:hypothetical protein